MALMTSMRERMHVVLWGLLFMFLLSMTIGGLVGAVVGAVGTAASGNLGG